MTYRGHRESTFENGDIVGGFDVQIEHLIPFLASTLQRRLGLEGIGTCLDEHWRLRSIQIVLSTRHQLQFQVIVIPMTLTGHH